MAGVAVVITLGGAALVIDDLAGGATHSSAHESASTGARGVGATTGKTADATNTATSVSPTAAPSSQPAHATEPHTTESHTTESHTTESHSQVGPAAATAQLGAIAAGEPSDGVSVAAANLSTGSTFTWGTASGMTTASVAKLDILETLLFQHQQAGATLSASEDDDAQNMIEHSDNDAADELWADVGSDPAITAANQTFALKDTVAGADGYWGLTTTSASDQVTLLKQLVGSSPLDAASQAYALTLMRSVEADQTWGVSVVADANTSVALKNGWLAVDNDNDLWAVGSDGLITVHGQTVAIAVLTQHQASEDAGIDLVQTLAAATVAAVS